MQTMLIENSSKKRKDRCVWTTNDYMNFLYTLLISLEDILRADFVSALWCFVRPKKFI